jgi:hypothetical protein
MMGEWEGIVVYEGCPAYAVGYCFGGQVNVGEGSTSGTPACQRTCLHTEVRRFGTQACSSGRPA